MKKHSLNNIAKKFFLGSLLSAAVFLSANANTIANNMTPVTTGVDSVAGKLEIRYAGLDNNELSFSVKYNNPTGNSFNLLVLDENGENLFKGTYSDKKFEKKFKLPKTEINNLTFLIQAGKETFKEKFDVNISTREVEDVIVRKN